MKRLFELDGELFDIAKDYCSNPELYVQKWNVTINGKIRHIITYTSGENGSKLRSLHQSIRKCLSGKYSSSKQSFAYKKKFNIRKCIECHLNSDMFLKTDIHAYFDSIDYDILYRHLLKLQVCKGHPEEIDTLLRACFYNNSLPIGFITSPVLSDIYLMSLDRKMARMEGIIYSRYADDFIISSDGGTKENLQGVLKTLSEELTKYKLELNEEKTYIRSLDNAGDAIHLLGVNIVKDDTYPNSITISDRNLRDICKDCGEYITKKKDNPGDVTADLLEKVIRGKINFVGDISDRSYSKLEKMISVKCGKAAVEIFFGQE